MRYWVVLVVVLLGLSPLGVLAQDSSLRVYTLEDAADLLNAYYGELFALSGFSYDEPMVVFLKEGDTVTTLCGPATGGSGFLAFYCSLDRIIVMDRYMDEDTFGDSQEFEYLVLAHEWGHYIQDLAGADYLGIDTYKPNDWDATEIIEQELRSDCLAGVFMKLLESLGQFDMFDVVEMSRVWYEMGGLSWFGYRNSHGLGEDRVAALLTGYTDGVFGCMNITPLATEV